MKDLSFIALLDVYGEALTQKQRDMLTDYYARDFSLSEIGDNYAVSPQAVHFAIKQAEKSLTKYENNFGVCGFISELYKRIDDIKQSKDTVNKVRELEEYIRSKYGTVR